MRRLRWDMVNSDTRFSGVEGKISWGWGKGTGLVTSQTGGTGGDLRMLAH